MAAVARVVATGSIVAAAAQLLWRRLRRCRARRQFDGLDGVVSFSSRLIAAARAIESLRPDALFVDPFASLLAGPKAMARHQGVDSADNSSSTNAPAGVPPEPNSNQQQQQQQDIIQQHQQQQQQTDMQEGRQVSRLVLRTVFFDEATLLATGRPAPWSHTALAAVAAHIQQHQLQPCRQVVMLGAGMDTRPWRLPLDPQLSWFEVDGADVLAAKQRALQEAGAGFTAASTAAVASTAAADSSKQTSSGSSSDSGSGGRNDGSGSSSSSSGVQHPLRVGQWACASADLQKAGWVKKLQEAGLQADTPTVWAAEGLLYYLEPSTVAPMLKEAASTSPPGSMIITNFMTEEGLQLLRAPQPTPPRHAAAGVAASSSATDAQLRPSPAAADSSEQAATPAVGGSSTSSTGVAGGNATEGTSSPAVANAAASSCASGREEDSSKQGASSGSWAGRQAGALVGAESCAKASGGAEARRTNLTSSFKWGCPDNVEQFFAECGWQLLVRYSVTSCTRAYGWSLQQTPGSRTQRTDRQQVQYVVGVAIK